MRNSATKLQPKDNLKEIIHAEAAKNLYEIHQGPPPFWNADIDSKFDSYLNERDLITFTTCPECGHQIKAHRFADDFADPWWSYPQRVFQDVDTCVHFENLSFSILWTQSEPMGAPWIVPCGWGVPALSESLSQNENLLTSLKISHLNNGAIIFWMGLFRQHPGIPILGDFWPLPILKSRASVQPSLNSRGFWGEFSPLSVQTPAIWSRLYIEAPSSRLLHHERNDDPSTWLKKIRTWNQLAYNQPLKMYRERFISESGITSFAIGMRSARARGALFISQTPVFAPSSIARASLHKDNSDELLQSHLQPLNIEQLRDISHTDSLWAVIDPFQNEACQDWLRLIKIRQLGTPLPLWAESKVGPNWQLTADSSNLAGLEEADLFQAYRDLSPFLVKVTPDIFELSLRYTLGLQSWGVFFTSGKDQDQLHHYLRKLLVCNFQNQWIYFRFYEPNYLSATLSALRNQDLDYFYGPVESWIFRDSSETSYTLYTTTNRSISDHSKRGYQGSLLPIAVHEMAQRVFQTELPRRIREFVKDRTPEFSALIPEIVLDRWIRDSIKQAQHWGIKKEVNLIKFFLWKVLISPSWCHLSPFVRVLQQSVAEEVKVQQIENLFPQIQAAEIPRGLSIEAWDAELWTELRKNNSPMGNADPEAFHPLLGERPPTMPLQNPKWLKALGLFYESAYADLFIQSGRQLVSSLFSSEIQRPQHAPPRLLSISPHELLIRDEGGRSQGWLKEHGFEGLTSNPGSWIHRSHNPKALLLLTRQFLEEFPYVEGRSIFENLDAHETEVVISGIEIFSVTWDSHSFWALTRW